MLLVIRLPLMPSLADSNMSLSASTHMNISGGAFNNVRRDQIQNIYSSNFARLRSNDVGHDLISNQTQVLMNSIFGPRQTLHGSDSASDFLAPAPATFSQGRVFVPAYQLPKGISIVDKPICLIVRIVQLLVRVEQSSNTTLRDLRLELIALHESLVMT